MFAVVVLIFMVCWAPYHIYFILVFHKPSITKASYIGHLYLFFYWLAMANSCVNPIIYYWMNAKFRAYFNKVLFCLPQFLQQFILHTWKSISSLKTPHSCYPVEYDRLDLVRSFPKKYEGLPDMKRRCSVITCDSSLPVDSHMSHICEVLF